MKTLKNSITIFLLAIAFGCEKPTTDPSPTGTTNTTKTCQYASQKNTALQNGAESEVLDYAYSYDKTTRKLTQTIKSNKNSFVKNNTYTYDSNDRLVEVSTPADFYDNIKYDYDIDGRVTFVTRRIQKDQSVSVIAYRYKDATTIETYEYANTVANANLKRAQQITINDKKSPLKIDVIEVIGGTNYKGNQTTYTYNANGQILTQTTTLANGTVSSVSRYVYDASGGFKTYIKSGASAEYLSDEYSEPLTATTPKSNFKAFIFSVAEPWANYGVNFSMFGKIKTYDSKGGLYSTFERKLEYDADNVLKKQTTAITIGSNKNEIIIDYTVACQ